MKDRIPGSPGQCKAVISADELQKMLAGQEFTIKLVRDDDPVVAGTPYSKAAVLPDTVAAAICPDISDPTPADAFGALQNKAAAAQSTANTAKTNAATAQNTADAAKTAAATAQSTADAAKSAAATAQSTANGKVSPGDNPYFPGINLGDSINAVPYIYSGNGDIWFRYVDASGNTAYHSLRGIMPKSGGMFTGSVKASGIKENAGDGGVIRNVVNRDAAGNNVATMMLSFRRK